MKKLIDVLYRRQNYLIGIAVFLALSAVSITVSKGQTKVNLSNYPILMIGLILISILLVIIYIKIDQDKIAKLTKKIKNTIEDQDKIIGSPENLLTKRQFEVYQLLVDGNSNKEIMGKLFIEQSTLKSHINQIYKKLHIKNRKELRSNIIN